MADPVRITIPPEVAAFVRPEISREDRLRGAGGISSLPPRQQILLLFCLGKDADPEVRARALKSLASLGDEQIAALRGWDDLHPALLHLVAECSGNRPFVRDLLLSHPCLADATRTVLNLTPVKPVPGMPPASDAEAGEESEGELPESPELPEGQVSAEDGSETEPLDEESEEFRSKYQLAQNMGIAEKIKTALTGDKEWRKILVKDSNKLVSSGVLKNPRITDSEVLTILKSSVQNEEIIRLICANKEWVKNLQIRKALIENPKTPLANALRYLGTMSEKDIAGYAKSRNISSVLSTQAKRLLLAKKK